MALPRQSGAFPPLRSLWLALSLDLGGGDRGGVCGAGGGDRGGVCGAGGGDRVGVCGGGGGWYRGGVCGTDGELKLEIATPDDEDKETTVGAGIETCRGIRPSVVRMKIT